MQNFPLFKSVTTGASTHITGVLHSKASTVYDLDFYANNCSNFPREFAEGQIWIGTSEVTTDGNGDATFDVTFPVATAAATRITTTATDPSGNTSEFSQGLAFRSGPPSGPAAGGTSIQIKGTDFAAGATVTVGGVPATDVIVARRKDDQREDPGSARGCGERRRGDKHRRHHRPGLQGLRERLPRRHLGNLLLVRDDPRLQRHHRGSRRRQLRRRPTHAAPADGRVPLKAKLGLCYVPPPCVGTFADVPCPSIFAPWIEDLAARGITAGCGGSNYCPATPCAATRWPSSC